MFRNKEKDQEQVKGFNLNFAQSIKNNKKDTLLLRLSVYLLAFSVLPILFLSLYFQHQLKHEQESTLSRAYDDYSLFMAEQIDQKVSNIKEVMLTLGQNQSLQEALKLRNTNDYYFDKDLRQNFETYIWYNLTSNRSIIKNFRIYSRNAERHIGYFISPYEYADKNVQNILEQQSNYVGLTVDANSELYYMYPIFSRFGNEPVAHALAGIDKDKAFSNKGQMSTRENSFASIILMGDKEVKSSYPNDFQSPYVEVNRHCPLSSLDLRLLIPYRSLHVDVLPLIFFAVLILVIFVLLFLLINRQLRILREQIIQEQNMVQVLQYNSLQRQMNPHFLYNTLSMINWKAKYAGQEDISDITLRLSKYYRLVLNNGNPYQSLEKAFSMAEIYLSLKKELMDEDLNFELDLDEKIKDRKIINFILQPLVENAVVHGISATGQDGSIKIKAKEVTRNNAKEIKSEILILIYDDGRGLYHFNYVLDESESGFAIKNIATRLQLAHGKNYGLALYSGDEVYKLNSDLAEDTYQNDEDFKDLLDHAKEKGTLTVLFLP